MPALLGKGPIFSASRLFTDVADDGTALLRLTVPESYKFCGYVLVGAQGAVRAALYEAPTFSGAGTAVTVYDLGRDDANSANITVRHTPTASDNGTLIHSAALGDAAQSIEKPPWVFKEDEDYLVLVTNKSGGAIDISIEFVGWEVAV